MALRSIELFAGGGGLALGLHAVGVRTVCFVEREAYAAAVLAARMEDGFLPPAPVWSDVTTFDGHPWRGVVDLIAGGFPCQDISSAGKRAGIIDGERSGLWREFARIIREVGPRLVFVENVAALVVRGLDVVLGDLAALGFDAEWGVFRASDVGAPHRRERVFILAHRQGGGFGVVGDAVEPGRGRHPDGSKPDLAHTIGLDSERRGGAGDIPCPPPPPAREAPERERGGDAPLDRGTGSTEGVALPKCPRLSRPERAPLLGTGRREEGRATAELRGARLEDPVRGGRGSGGEREGLPPDAPPSGDLDLADTDGRRCGLVGIGRLRDGKWPVGGDDADRCGGRAPWPPLPGDADGWRAYLDRWPLAAPAVTRAQSLLRGGPDGLAAGVDPYQRHRVDRLRVLGNGVVPDQAALAWEVLMQRMDVTGTQRTG